MDPLPVCLRSVCAANHVTDFSSYLHVQRKDNLQSVCLFRYQIHLVLEENDPFSFFGFLVLDEM